MVSGNDLMGVASERLVRLTTRGRRTGCPHTVELWFAVSGGRVYLSHEGEETDWMKNIRKNARVSFEMGRRNFVGTVRYLEGHSEEAELAKTLLYEKYYGREAREVIEDWFSLSRLFVIEP